MKKSLIAAAVAGLFAAPAAMADVTISGAINLGIEIADSDDATGGSPASLSRTLLNANYSNINISSSDDIGDGNKVIFNYQLVVNPADVSGGNPVNRNSYLGVAGTWGAFKMGSNENVYERFMYQADPLDGALGPGGNLMILGTPGAGTAFEVGQDGCDSLGAAFVFDPTTGAGIANPAAGTGGCVGFYRRTDQTIWYESPNWNGFTFEVDYTLSAFKTGDPGGTDPTVLSAGVKWQPEGLPFYLDAAIEQHDDMFGANRLGAVGGTGSSDDAVQIGGGFNIAGFNLHARFESLSYETDGSTSAINSYERDAMWFAVKYNLPSGYIGGEIGIADEGDTNLGTAVDTGATMYGIGYFHNLSKQSQLQFIYAITDNDAAATYTQAGAPNGGAPGADHSVIHVGLKHTF
jgi:predicted porin